MAWKKVDVRSNEEKTDEVWVSFGKEPKGEVHAKVLKEGESIEGYIEKITKSAKFKQPIVSLINGNIRYLMFAPRNLEKKIDSLLEEVEGKMVYTRITFLEFKEDGDRKAYSFEVEYDDENVLEE